LRRVGLCILIGACIAGPLACARARTESAPGPTRNVTVAAECPRIRVIPTEPSEPPDDTTLVMRAIGQQLCKDYRGGPLLFSVLRMCGDVHPQPCDFHPPQIPNVTKVPRYIDVAMQAAGGAPCFPASCSVTGTLAEFELNEPRIYSDSAFVKVTIILTADRTASSTYFERHVYRANRMSRWAWRATARYLESHGHYEP
jgi:hypothetical protein